MRGVPKTRPPAEKASPYAAFRSAVKHRGAVIEPIRMRNRPLGKTGLVVSELAIGTWGLSGDSYGPIEETEAELVLRRAIDMGFSLIDTSDAYGAGRMERLSGKLAKDHPGLVVVTKGGIDRTTDPPRKC